MIETLVAMFSHEFITRAVVVGMMVSLCAALLGVSLVLKRYAMIGDGLSHVGFGALAVATATGMAPMAVCIPVVVGAALLLLRISSDSSIKGDAAVALISTGALAIGVLVLSTASGMNVDINNYMFGSILSMSKEDVNLSVVLSAAVLLVFIFFYHRMFAITFDESFAKASGASTGLLNMLTATLTAITIVLGMRMMGSLLISSLIIFPALTAMRVCKSYKGVILFAAVVSEICFLAGVAASFLYSLPTGASVVAANLIAFLLFSLAGRLKSISFHGAFSKRPAS